MKYPFQGKQRTSPGQRLDGTVTFPQGSKIVHVGAEPPVGEMYLYCEVSPVQTPDVTLEFAILQVEDEIPNGYTYRGYILATPPLFIFEKGGSALLTS